MISIDISTTSIRWLIIDLIDSNHTTRSPLRWWLPVFCLFAQVMVMVMFLFCLKWLDRTLRRPDIPLPESPDPTIARWYDFRRDKSLRWGLARFPRQCPRALFHRSAGLLLIHFTREEDISIFSISTLPFSKGYSHLFSRYFSRLLVCFEGIGYEVTSQIRYIFLWCTVSFFSMHYIFHARYAMPILCCIEDTDAFLMSPPLHSAWLAAHDIFIDIPVIFEFDTPDTRLYFLRFIIEVYHASPRHPGRIWNIIIVSSAPYRLFPHADDGRRAIAWCLLFRFRGYVSIRFSLPAAFSAPLR